MPFGQINEKLIDFLIDSFVMVADNFQVEYEINMNAVLNAPNIETALS
jgi:hypothetical protein